MSTQLYRWVTYSQVKPELYKNVIAHDVEEDGITLMALPRLGAYFEDEDTGKICFQVYGTQNYADYVVQNEHIDRIVWLAPAEIPTPYRESAEEVDKRKLNCLITAGRGRLFSLSEREIIFSAMEEYASQFNQSLPLSKEEVE